MDFFVSFPHGILWVFLLCPADIHATGQECSGKVPVIVPSVLVVKYGGPATATCHAQYPAEKIGWETTVGAKTEENTQQLDWSVNSTDWSLRHGIACFTTSGEHGQCSTRLPITFYKIPESVTLTNPGEQYLLECELDSVAPVNKLTVTWFRGDTELEHRSFPHLKGARPTTVRVNLDLSTFTGDRGGNYSCVATLDLNTTEPIPESRSNSIHLIDDTPWGIIPGVVAVLLFLTLILFVIWRRPCRRN